MPVFVYNYLRILAMGLNYNYVFLDTNDKT